MSGRGILNKILFNMHDVLLLMTAGLALLLAMPLAMRRDAQHAERLLAGFLATQGISSLCFVFLYSPILRPHTIEALHPFHNLPLALTCLFQGVLLLAYSYAMAGRPLRLSRGDIIMLGLWCFSSLGTAASFLANPDTYASQMVGISDSFAGMVVSVYFGGRAIWVLRRHNRDIRQHYSNIDRINLLWLSYAAFGFVGIWLVRLGSYFAIIYSHKETADLIGLMSNYPSLLLISWMVVLGLGQRGGLSLSTGGGGLGPIEGKASREADPAQVEKLQELMTRVKLYQDPELNLEGLADSMDVSPRSLSSLINGHYQKNFYDFVNGFRIEAVKHQLADSDQADKSIQRIFEDAGFNSKSTFNTLFKKATGLTPSAYRREAVRTGPADRRSPAAP